MPQKSKPLIYAMAWLMAAALLTACASPPKGAQARVVARVSQWQETLNLRSLERQYDLPKGLLAAVMHQESRGMAKARSPAGAQGLFQIMPATARDLNLRSAYHPQNSARAAAQYLAQLQQRYSGDLKRTLAAYNWGMGNVDRYGVRASKMPKETRVYIARVTQLRKLYR